MELPVSRAPGDVTVSSPSASHSREDRAFTSADDRAGLRQRRTAGAEGRSPAEEREQGEDGAPWHKRAVQVSCVALLFLSLALLSAVLQLGEVQHKFSGLERARVPRRKAGKLPPIPVTERNIRAACNSREQTALHHHLQDIVLIINTNYEDAARTTSDFLRTVYGKFFKNIVILSREAIPDIQVYARGHKKWRKDWMFAYFHIPKVMAQYPDAAGYLWTNDDVAINYWHLLHANTSKLWMTNNLSSPQTKFFPFDAFKPAVSFDYWAGNKEFRESAWNSFKGMDDAYQQAYTQHILPLKDVYPKRIADTYYIPQRFAHAFAFDLLPIFRENQVWSEIGIPFIFYALDHPSNFDPVLDDMVLVEDRSNYDPLVTWNPRISALHPFKVSQNSSKAAYIRLLGTVDMCLMRLLPEYESQFNF